MYSYVVNVHTTRKMHETYSTAVFGSQLHNYYVHMYTYHCVLNASAQVRSTVCCTAKINSAKYVCKCRINTHHHKIHTPLPIHIQPVRRSRLVKNSFLKVPFFLSFRRSLEWGHKTSMPND